MRHAQVFGQVPRGQPLHRRLRAHRHEHRRFDHAVRRMQQPGARARPRTFRHHFKFNLPQDSMVSAARPAGQILPLPDSTATRESATILIQPCSAVPTGPSPRARPRQLLRAPKDTRRDAAFRTSHPPDPARQGGNVRASRGRCGLSALSPPGGAVAAHFDRQDRCPGSECWAPAAPSNSMAKPPWSSACAWKWKASASAASASTWMPTNTASGLGK